MANKNNNLQKATWRRGNIIPKRFDIASFYDFTIKVDFSFLYFDGAMPLLLLKNLAKHAAEEKPHISEIFSNEYEVLSMSRLLFS